ncbi:GreA/GreB family elongation factor [Fulvimarina sp. 2208YS6-2-32]|uniref:GreA/GreB family elongation factor n=1 Tax=Fulvimarina uroteuthidis TaxID=3098149 RepID=A0ABU5I877_9HYPH|nr:GreA/GreB family elongation factor [Fulvimarina sp. 2208YS6-2-32]MDY8111099.1 GreA/GreB family elongation factor [Fulvimarina sp. 2208YS6-2-32]
MSVAFVKEPNEDQVEVLPDRDLGTDPNIVTPRGLHLIDGEIAALDARLIEARDAGDKVALAHINRDLRYWKARHATAELVRPPHDPQTVQFGCVVSIERPDGREQRFTIVGIDEADPREGYLSYLSPLARTLIGKSVGDTVKAGASDAEITAIAAG